MNPLRDACIMAAQPIMDIVNDVEKQLNGREAYLRTRGKYQGRLGRITGVLADSRYGVLACLMIYKHGTKDFLNSDGATRSYRPLIELEIVGDS